MSDVLTHTLYLNSHPKMWGCITEHVTTCHIATPRHVENHTQTPDDVPDLRHVTTRTFPNCARKPPVTCLIFLAQGRLQNHCISAIPVSQSRNRVELPSGPIVYRFKVIPISSVLCCVAPSCQIWWELQLCQLLQARSA